MDNLLLAICSLAGVAFGAGVVWLATRGAARAREAAARAEGETVRVELQTRLDAETRRSGELTAETEELEARIAELDAARASEAERRATAEEKVTRIAELETTLAKRDGRIDELHETSAAQQAQISRLNTSLDEERKAMEEKKALLGEAEKKLTDVFKALATSTLESSNKSFLELAKATLEKHQEGAKGDLGKRQKAIDEIVKPLRESLGKMDKEMQELRNERTKTMAGLSEHITQLQKRSQELGEKTENLVNALRRPQTRGRWGEMQLHRVVELGGMTEHCDFDEQVTVNTEEGRLRPDMVIHLPGGRTIVVDAKTPLEACLDALEAPDEATRKQHLATHARHVRTHMKQLRAKNYTASLGETPEVVVLFLPGETFFNAAVEQDPRIVEDGMADGVVLATPMTLFALLRAVAYGWTQEQLTENARRISELGREIYDRLGTMGGHFAKLGRELSQAVEAYNSTLSSLESRVLVSARRFADLGVGSDTKQVDILDPVSDTPRLPQADEVKPTAGSESGQAN